MQRFLRDPVLIDSGAGSPRCVREGLKGLGVSFFEGMLIGNDRDTLQIHARYRYDDVYMMCYFVWRVLTLHISP